jgi:1-acyl-sn-glycerol-3-phosphate acyltransferase
MKKVAYGKIIYYNDLLKDDFANTNINAEKIADDYQYFLKNPLARLGSFLLLYLIAIPFLTLANFFVFRIKIIGRRHLRKIKTGYILYGNHTAHYDAFIPQALITRPRKTYIIAHPDAVSIPFIKHLTKALGAWPLPDTVKSSMRFLEAISIALKNNKAIAVYPEAHIWPFYTGIRPFPATSFQYASRNNVPAVPMVTTYRKPRGWLKNYRTPRMTVRIGPPIYPNPLLNAKENAAKMHEETLTFMNTYAQRKDNIALYQYLPKKAE